MNIMLVDSSVISKCIIVVDRQQKLAARKVIHRRVSTEVKCANNRRKYRTYNKVIKKYGCEL